MPEVKFDRDFVPMDCLGLDLNRPVDSVKPKKFPYLKNCRSFLAGRIEPREGITKIAQVVAGQTTVHSIRRLNDTLNGTYTRVIGTGTHLAYGQSVFTDLDSGYSSDPLALVPWKPKDSPNAFMYVADRSRMRKVTAQGGLHTIGWAAPNVAPGVTLSNSPKYKVVDDFTSLTGWAQAGTAGGPSLLSAGPGYRSNTSITYILYDSGTTGWASIVPASMAGIGPGERLNFNPGGGTDEPAVVQVAFPNSSSTTIASIVYDSGTTGLCSIVLTTPLQQVYCDALIRNTTVGPENARILSVTSGPDGTVSIRLSTLNTWAATNSVTVQASFRAYLANNHAATETVRIDGIRTAVTNGTGTLTKTSALDLSAIASGVLAQPDDFMHISFRISDPTVITEIRAQLALDTAPSVDANGGFTGNYYFKAFRSSDITSALAGTQSILANRTTVVQRSIVGQPGATPEQISAAAPPPVIDPNTGEDIYQFADYTYTNPTTGVTFKQTIVTQFTNSVTGEPINDNSSLQIGTGVSQWAELIFPISELMRVGQDTSKSLANVTQIQIYAIVTGNVNLDIDSWWIGGGYGLDNVNPTASPYHYRYRAREKSTNVPSNWSPSSRYNLQSFRQSADVKPTQYTPVTGTSLTTADFVLDIERFGGQLADWHYVGTVANSASSAQNPSGPTFTDIYDDNLVGGQPVIGQDNYQPWPTIGIPVSGTTGQVTGTSVKDSGTNFNTSWAPGTRILINNIPYTIYRVVSTSFLEIVENAGSQSAVSWRIDAPTILAQSLPCLWEWDSRFFACGDPTNPGRLYYSNTDSETTTPTNFLDATSPSEPLMNGIQYNIRSYTWSSEGFGQILKTGNPDEPYRHERIPNGKGLFSRWAVTLHPTPILCFLSKDSINMTVGGSPIALTDADLYPLFPNEGNLGQTVNGIAPPNIISVFAKYLRLEYYDEYLYFDYVDTNGSNATLVMAFDLGAVSRGEAPGGWFWDNYTPGVIMHYGEEGQGVHSLLVGTTGENLYQYTGNSDDGAAFSMELSTPSRDQSDSRLNKLYGDIMIDCNTAGLNVTATPFFNNNVSSGPSTVIANSVRGLKTIPLAAIANGTSWVTARNISLSLVVSISTSARPFFFAWEPRWTFEAAPISAVSWEISPTTFGMENFKHIGINKIAHVSTVDLSLIYIIDGIVQPAITITNSGGSYKQSIFRVPVMKGKLDKIRLASSDGITEFRLDPRDSFIEVKDWASDGAYNKLRVFGDFSLVEG